MFPRHVCMSIATRTITPQLRSGRSLTGPIFKVHLRTASRTSVHPGTAFGLNADLYDTSRLKPHALFLSRVMVKTSL